MAMSVDMVCSIASRIPVKSHPTLQSSTPTKSSIRKFHNASILSNRRRITNVRSHAGTEVAETVNRALCPPVRADIDIAAFQTLDLRVGLITQAKSVVDPEMTAKRGKSTMSRTHLQLSVDIGCEIRTVVSECKYAMDVEDAVGKKVLFAANISPRVVLGIRSHGLNYDPTPMPRSLKVISPGLGRLPPGSQVLEALIPR